jgi:hypothetical protein
MGVLELIESSAIATFVRESPSLLGYTAVLSLHAVGLAIVVGANAVVALRVLGVAPAVPLAPMTQFFPVMYTGFWINAVSGFLLLAANASNMLSNPMFYVKLVFIAFAVWAMLRLRSRVFADPAVLAAGVSAQGRRIAWATLSLWGLAIIAGRLTSYPYFVAAWFN